MQKCKNRFTNSEASAKWQGLLLTEDKPKSVIRLLSANEAIFLSSVSSLLGYNGTPLLPQSGETSVQK